MNKGQAVALLLAGAAAGVGGKEAVTAVLAPSAAVAEARKPFTHAVDLRRAREADPVRVTAYGSIDPLDGGGLADLGQGKCTFSATEQKALASCMNTVAKNCEWRR